MIRIVKDKSLYQSALKLDDEIPIFFQDWWMDIVAKDTWRPLVAVDNENAILSIWPLNLNDKKIFQGAGHPILTPINSFWHFFKQHPIQKTVRINAMNIRVLKAYTDRLNGFGLDYLECTLHQNMVNNLPFHWAGFSETNTYTDILKLSANRESYWASFERKVRKNIKKAKKDFQIYEGGQTDITYDLVGESLKRNGKKWIAEATVFRELTETCRSRGVGEQFYIKNRSGDPIVAIFTVWDNTTLYLLARGGKKYALQKGGMSLLVWHIIQKFNNRIGQIDFVGSTIEDIHNFNRAFGGHSTRRARITKYYNPWLKVFMALKKNVP